MSILVSAQTGNLSTATTWYLIKSNLAYVYTNTGGTTVAVGTPKYTDYFTPADAADSAVGACFIFTGNPAGATATVTIDLMEGTTVRATAVGTLNNTYAAGNIPSGGYFFMKFATPYVYGNTTAGTWRYRVTASGNTVYIGTTGTPIAYLEVVGTNQAPSANDTLIVTGNGTAAGAITQCKVTVDSNLTVGTAASTTLLGIYQSGGGSFSWGDSQAGSYTITSAGHCKFASNLPSEYGFEMGTQAHPLTSTYTQTFIQNQASNYQHEFDLGSSGATSFGTRISMVGNYAFNSTSLANHTTTLASSAILGATSIVLTVDMGLRAAGGDILMLGSTTAAKNGELVTVSAYNAGTKTATVSALAKAHASGGKVWLMSSNSNFNSSSITYPGRITSARITSGMLAFANQSYAYIYNTCFSNHITTGLMSYFNRTSVVSYNKYLYAGRAQFTPQGVDSTPATNNVYHCVGSSILPDSAQNNYLTMVVDQASAAATGLNVNSRYSCYLDNIWFDGNFLLGTANGGRISGTIHAVAYTGAGLSFQGNLVEGVGNNLILGSPVQNSSSDINIGNTPAFRSVTLNNTTIASASPIVLTYQSLMYQDSEVRLQNINANANDNRLYKAEGTLQTTGAGLTDTTTRTVGTTALSLTPIGTAFYYSVDTLNKTIKKAVKANSTVVWYGYMRKNAAYGSANRPKVTLTSTDGSLNLTTTMTDVTDTWEIFTLAGNVGASDTSITLKLECPSNVLGAVCYFADMQLVIGNITTGVATGFKVGSIWKDGSPTADETLGGTVDATFLENAVWNSLTASHTTADTFGKQASDTKQLADDCEALILTK